MQVLQAVMLAGRAGILRSARLPRHMAVEAAAMGKGLLQQVLAVVAEASVRRALLHPHQVQMVQEAEAAAVCLRASAL